jgi:hypothetical protein
VEDGIIIEIEIIIIIPIIIVVEEAKSIYRTLNFYKIKIDFRIEEMGEVVDEMQGVVIAVEIPLVLLQVEGLTCLIIPLLKEEMVQEVVQVEEGRIKSFPMMQRKEMVIYMEIEEIMEEKMVVKKEIPLSGKKEILDQSLI